MEILKNHTFRDDIKVYSGLKDYYGHTMLILVDDNIKHLRTVGKLPDYKKHRHMLDVNGFSYIGTPEYAEVIDITRATYKKITEEFPGYSHTQWQIWD